MRHPKKTIKGEVYVQDVVRAVLLSVCSKLRGLDRWARRVLLARRPSQDTA